MDRVVVDLELGRGYMYGLDELSIAGFEVAVTWSEHDGFRHWGGGEGRALIDYLLLYREIVGFNLLGYDHRVLQGYLLPHERGIAAELRRRTVDLHTLLQGAAGRRASLEEVARATLGEGKLPAPRTDDPALLAAYCERDVELTRDLDRYRRAYGLLHLRGESISL